MKIGMKFTSKWFKGVADEYKLCSDGFNPRYNNFEYSMDEEGEFTSTRLLLYEDPYKLTYHPYRNVKWKPARSGTIIFFENIKNARYMKIKKLKEMYPVDLRYDMSDTETRSDAVKHPNVEVDWMRFRARWHNGKLGFLRTGTGMNYLLSSTFLFREEHKNTFEHFKLTCFTPDLM